MVSMYKTCGCPIKVLVQDTRTPYFWNKKKEEIFGKIAHRLSKDKPRELLGQTLPNLARVFDKEALQSLKDGNLWLAEWNTRSEAGLEESKKAFLQDGTGFIDILVEFTELMRAESHLAVLLKSSGSRFSTRLLLAIAKDLKDVKPPKSTQPIEPNLHESPDNILNANIEHNIPPDRISALLGDHAEASKSNVSQKNRAHKAESNVAARCIFELLWETEFEKLPHRSKSSARRTKTRDKIVSRFFKYLSKTQQDLGNIKKGHILFRYKQRLRKFVSQVGCLRDYPEPEDNINELRLFLSTTMSHFAKLQEQYMEMREEVRKHRRYISALQFRYLLEHLPDPKLDSSAGPRWEKFWMNSLQHEANNNSTTPPALPDHVLKDLVDQRNPTRLQGDPRNGPRSIHTRGQKGFLFEKGNTLYTSLSDEIHGYSYGEFKIDDSDGWDKVTTEILRALKPLDENTNRATLKVDWAAERARYYT
ncbi:unnamed protein product [Clonostachys solani]|uniref:Uncharacterized protein n=1 Tax=Clonostachys solani TaxID=160281 RepID=A0A9N9VZE3_9HYPO|nr:unnamed protein product [Clonostachys solani]